MPVHLYGQMCDMKKMRKLADKYNLKIIEDAAHCLEGIRDGVRPGELGDTACFSFYATKSITCGEGGAVITNDEKIAEKIKKMRLHGLTKNASERYNKKFAHWDVEMFGWKYNMDNIQAALLLNQMQLIDALWQKRENLYKYYVGLFKTVDTIELPKILIGVKHANHLFTIWVDAKKRDAMVDKLDKCGIPVQVNYRPIHLMSYFRKNFGYKNGDFPIAEKIGMSTITLPFYPKLKKTEANHVAKGVEDVLNKK